METLRKVRENCWKTREKDKETRKNRKKGRKKG